MPMTHRRFWTGLIVPGLIAIGGCGPAPAHNAVDADSGNVTETIATPPVAPEPAPVATPKPVAAPAKKLPAEVVAFKTRRDQCDHFRGEDTEDEARAADIAHKLERTCTGTDAALKRLRQRYATDASVRAALAKYDDEVE